MARLAGKHRGDMRAMEEEMERTNPISGRANLRVDRRHMPIMGMGATPSMGLSQFRGGGTGAGDSDGEEMEGGGFLGDLVGQFNPMLGSVAGMVGLGNGDMTRMVGAGRKKKGMSEATQMGLHLGKHLHSLHGAGFFDDFKQGFMSVIRPVAGIAKSVAPLLGPEGMAASGVMNAIGLGSARRGARGRPRKGMGTGAGKLVITHGGATNSDTGAYHGKGTGAGRGRRGCGTGAGRERDDMAMMGMGTGAGMLGQDGHGVRQGGGFLSDLGIPVISNLAGMVGLGTGAGEGCGTGAGTGGRRRRAPAGANDGRRKRAEVVKKVMADKGLSMIEASKYVKAHNLY